MRPKVVGLIDPDRERANSPRCCQSAPNSSPDSMLSQVSLDQADVVVNGVVGFAGLPVTLAALSQGSDLRSPTRESLIAAGPVVERVRSTPGAEIIPVDSEHCAVHMCLRAGEGTRQLRRIVLTASGGPFHGYAVLEEVTIDQALAHPTWSMGPKITIDSSTLA